MMFLLRHYGGLGKLGFLKYYNSKWGQGVWGGYFRYEDVWKNLHGRRIMMPRKWLGYVVYPAANCSGIFAVGFSARRKVGLMDAGWRQHKDYCSPEKL